MLSPPSSLTVQNVMAVSGVPESCSDCAAYDFREGQGSEMFCTLARRECAFPADWNQWENGPLPEWCPIVRFLTPLGIPTAGP